VHSTQRKIKKNSVISVGSARGSVFAWNQINTTNKKICKPLRFRDRGTPKSTIADSDAAIYLPGYGIKIPNCNTQITNNIKIANSRCVHPDS
jgi:hypothetical protein